MTGNTGFFGRLSSSRVLLNAEHLCKPALGFSEPCRSGHDSASHLWTVAGQEKGLRRSTAVVVFCRKPAPVFSRNSSHGAARRTARILVCIIFSAAASTNRILGCWDAAVLPRPSAATCRMPRSITASRERRRRPCPIMVAADIRLVGQLR